MLSFTRHVAKNPRGRISRHFHRILFGHSFNRDDRHRLLILFDSKAISYAAVFPFLDFADVFASRYNAQIRLLPVQQALEGGLPKGLADPSSVVVQTGLTDPPRHAALVHLLESLPAPTTKVFLDTFANTDIRLARTFGSVDLYFKKSLFIDRREFMRPTCGDTNLVEYYSRLYDLPCRTTDWQVPETALPKLRLAPNFLTAPHLAAAFLSGGPPPSQAGRDIDLHARLGGIGKEGWYGEMRRHADRVAKSLEGVVTVTGSGVSSADFEHELRRARICFSPFGYGELCWRDIEAILAGAVLLKPDMSHLETEPDLFEDGTTYVACAWDFSDVTDKVQALLGDAHRRARIAQEAWRRARDYLVSNGPVETYAPIFGASRTAAAAPTP